VIKFFLITAIVSLSAAKWSHAQVAVDGLLPEDAAKLAEAYPDLKNLRASPRELDEIIQILSRTENYMRIDALRSGDGHTVKAEALKRISEIKISGADAVEETQILNAIGLKPGSLYDGGRMAQAADSVKELYGKRGYFNATVKFTYVAPEPATLIVNVVIVENRPCLITSIVFEGVNRDLTKRLQNKVKRSRNKPFTEEEIIELERRAADYLSEERYLNSKVVQKEALYNEQKTSATLYYQVTDPYKYEVAFKGNNPTLNSTGDLLSQLNLDEFDRASLDPAADIAQTIRSYYINSGYAHSKITYEVRASETQYLKQILVTIDEGAYVKLEKIEVTGRISRAPNFYEKFIKKNSSNLIDRGGFSRRDLDEGTKNLIIQLNNEGFLRAKVQSTRVEFRLNGQAARVEIVLDEGPLTQLRRITFIGNNHYSEKELLQVLKIKSNAPLRLNDLEQSVALLQKHYLDRGHLEMRFENEDDQLVQYDDKGATANITFRIYEGPRISIGSIVLEGNNFTKDDVILRTIELSVGEVLTPEKIEEAKMRLERLSIFTRIEVRTLEANTNIAKRPLLVSVTEDNPGTFRVGFGANNERDLTLRAFTGISYNNLGGSARALSGRVNVQNNIVGHQYTEYEVGVSYLEPFLLDSKFRGRVNLSREESVDNVETDGSREQLTIERTDDLNFNVERDLTSRIRFSWRIWGIETVKTFSAGDTISADADTKIQIATIGPLVDIDFRDNPFLPTRGTFTRFEADYASNEFGSSQKIHFLRTQGTFSHFLRVFTPKVVWANSVSTGWEKNLNTDRFSGVPLSYAFFLGGFSTIRGYSGTPSDRTPNDSELDNNANKRLIVPGEANYYLVKSELRYPIYGILGGVVFYDAGKVEVKRDNDLALGFDGPSKSSYGLGIRINTPVGPFSLDYGRKTEVNRGTKESPDHWHLYFGTF
jgi:outer membrane protein insertion porin family